MRFLISITLLISACGQNAQYIDPAFDENLADLQLEFGKTGKEVDVRSVSYKFGELKNGVQAECRASDKLIVVRKSSWDKYNFTFRKYLLAHEIGHCVLGRGHDDTKGSIEGSPIVPKSIMYPSSDEPANYAAQMNNYYFHELVNGLAFFSDPL